VWVKDAFIGPRLRPAQAMGSKKRLVSLRSISTSRLTHLLSHVLLHRSRWSSRYTSRNRSSMSLCASNLCSNLSMPLSLNRSRLCSRHLSLSHQRRNRSRPLRLHLLSSRNR